MVKVGVVPEGNLNDAGHATALAVPSAVNSSTKLATTLVGTLVIESVVIAALSDTAKKLLVLKSSVNVPADIGGVALASREDRNVGLSMKFPARLCVPLNVFSPVVA